MAPAHDPFIDARSMWPASTILSASKSSPVKKAARRPSKASVASVCTTGRTPVKRPKFDSIPQIATM
jgi:hypothetical protein